MSVVACDLARGVRGVPTPGPDGTRWDSAWTQFVIGIAYTAIACTGLQTAATAAGNGFVFDSAMGDTVLRSAGFAQGGGSLGSARAAAPPLVTFDWTGEQALRIELNAAWNTIKEFQLARFTGTTLTLANWVDVDLRLTDAVSRTIAVEGLKRGNIRLGDGNDVVTLGVEANNADGGATIHLATGGGNDTITIRATATDYSPGAYDGRWTSTMIDAGSGDDVILGWRSNDTVDGGTGTDTFVLGGLRPGYDIRTVHGLTTVVDVNLADGNDGTDTLRNVEYLRFADGSLLALDTAANHAPVVKASSAAVTEAQANVLLPALSNATDADGDTLSLVSASALSGTVRIEGAGILYTPNPATKALNTGQSAADTITYTVGDGYTTSTGTIALTVTGISDAQAGPVPTITVGAGKQYATLAAAVAAARDGDVVGVDAGTYVNDFATVNAKITIMGVGGMANFVATGLIPNGKGILITNTDVTIDHLAFSGAAVTDHNGAGIRYQGGNLVITHAYFHGNEDGILANPSSTGTISIDHSEFASNGYGDGQSHGIYVNNVAKLTITDSYFHDARVGHEIKSRAAETVISNSRIYDNAGTASYSIDLPNGGRASLSNNVIEQGPNSENPAIVHFGGEGTPYAGSTLTMTGNTVVNHLASSSAVMLLNHTAVAADVSTTSVYGLSAGQLANGPAVITGTMMLGAEPHLDTSSPWF